MCNGGLFYTPQAGVFTFGWERSGDIRASRDKQEEKSCLVYHASVSPFCLLFLFKSSGNLRRVSSSATPSSVGLQLLKQRHLITADAMSYVCVCVKVK